MSEMSEKDQEVQAIGEMSAVMIDMLKAFNGKYPVPENAWLLRLKRERDALMEKHQKLDDILMDDMINECEDLEDGDRFLLHQQRSAMAEYGRILDARIIRAES